MDYFKRLLVFAKPFWKTITVISVLILFMSGLRQVEPIVFKRITDSIGTGVGKGGFKSTEILNLLLVFLVVKILYPILNRISWYLANIFSYRLRFNLREYAYEHLMSLPMTFFNTNQSGKLMNQIERGATQLTQIINNSGMYFLPNVITAIIGLIIMSTYSWAISLTILGIFIPVALVNYWKFIKNQDYEKQENDLYDNQYGHFWETVSAIEIIKSFVAENFELRQFKQFHSQIYEIRKKIEKNHNIFTIADVILEAAIWAIYAWIIYLTYEGSFTLGTMVLMISYISIIREPLWVLNWIFWEAKRAQIGAKDYFKIIGQESDIVDDKDPIEIETIKGEIKFKNVSFTYKDGAKVFEGVSFSIPAGTSCALVGKSGAGKTTIAGLLNRYFDIGNGKILIDGLNIQKIRIRELRKKVGMVTQEAYLFADTIKENLRYGNPKATEEEMVRACKASSAHQFIIDLKDGYDTKIGERGTKLSGGQKQRLSMARAILKNPRILILDEATSQLDSESEALIQKSMAKIMKDRTTILIAHRLSTIKKADRIIVFDKGKILEQGTHEELMANGKLYASLFDIQAGKTEFLKEWELVE